MSDLVRFQRGVHTTVQHIGYQDIATLLGLQDVVNLEDITNADEVIKDSNDAILWESPVLIQAPRDPLWSVQFAFGAKTVNDRDGVRLYEYMTQLSSIFLAGENLEVRDYSPVPGDPGYGDLLGNMYISEVTLDDSAGEEINTFQLLRVSAGVVRA